MSRYWENLWRSIEENDAELQKFIEKENEEEVKFWKKYGPISMFLGLLMMIIAYFLGSDKSWMACGLFPFWIGGTAWLAARGLLPDPPDFLGK